MNRKRWQIASGLALIALTAAACSSSNSKSPDHLDVSRCEQHSRQHRLQQTLLRLRQRRRQGRRLQRSSAMA